MATFTSSKKKGLIIKKLPIGIQTFSELIKNDYIYIDKTSIIHTLITTGKYYFFARPRRFGKSLLVSTLANIFLGNKDLFTGFAINSLPYQWKKHPVVAISFADIPQASPEALESGIKSYLQGIAKQYGLILDKNSFSSEMLRELVMELELLTKESVVLLIDEYDYPLLRHLHNQELAHNMREALRDFYAVIKGLDPYLKFVLLTGVSKFSKTSIFSGLNNLQDISLNAQYNALLGYTENEIIHSFETYLTKITHDKQISMEELLTKIKTWYNGYRFTGSDNAITLYNPYSILLFLSEGRFHNYWFETGTPTFLINLLKTKHYPLQDFEYSKASASELGQFEIDDIELKTLLFQTGYITIKSYNEESRNYILGYPNKETIDSLAEHIIKSMTNLPSSHLNDSVTLLLKAFEQNNIEKIFSTLTQLFDAVPYTIHIGEEKYYQTIFYLVLKMIDANIIVEQPTNIGRIDAVITTKTSYFIIEFKINSTALKALEQIEAKKYYQPYENLKKDIILVGIAFDTTLKNITEIKHKKLIR